MKIQMKLSVEKIGKNFGEKKIFRDISFELSPGMSAAIVGPNGSGKTTLVRIICGLIRQSAGEVKYIKDNKQILMEDIYKNIGFVGPYLELYEELTARENIMFFAKMKRVPNAVEKFSSLMNRLNLIGRDDDQVKTYSSGMKQRLKYVFALIGDPEILILDEPTSNLDTDGIDRVYDIMIEQKKNKLLLLATNDQMDLKYGDFKVEVTA